MFYIKGIHTYGIEVVDTDDYASEFYTAPEVLEIAKKVKIYGVSGDDISVFSLQNYIKAAMARDKLNDIVSEYILEGDKQYIKLQKLMLPRSQTYKVLDGTKIVDVSRRGKCREISVDNADYSVVLPKSCDTLEEKCFASTNITSINLEYVKNIEWRAFSSCVKLRHIDLSSASSIGSRAFGKCTSLISAKLNPSCEYVRDVFFECPNLELPPELSRLKGGND